MATTLSGRQPTVDRRYLSGIFYIVNLPDNIYTQNIDCANFLNIVKRKFKKRLTSIMSYTERQQLMLASRISLNQLTVNTYD